MTTYYKLLRPDLIHYDFIYKEGLNELSEPFNPGLECGSGGLYYSDQDNIFKYLELYSYDPDLLIGIVSLPDNAKFVSINMNNEKKYKSDKIILSDIQRLDNMLSSDPVITLKAVKHNGYALQYVKEQTKDICIEAVKQNGFALQYVKEQSADICIEAVKQNGMALCYVKEQTEDICTEAVKQYGMALQYVEEQTDDICIKAVQKNGMALHLLTEERKKSIWELLNKIAMI
jgi:hypothetical protein